MEASGKKTRTIVQVVPVTAAWDIKPHNCANRFLEAADLGVNPNNCAVRFSTAVPKCRCCLAALAAGSPTPNNCAKQQCPDLSRCPDSGNFGIGTTPFTSPILLLPAGKPKLSRTIY